MRKRTRLVLVLAVIVVCVGLAALKTLNEVGQSADLSCFNSICYELSRNPELLSKVSIPSSAEWHELDEKACTELIKAMIEKGSIDCRALKKKMTQTGLAAILRIHVMRQENGSYRVRVITPGADQRIGSDDDEVFQAGGAGTSK